jgi:tRNA(fMet)-specific endonuclease VapC
MIVLDTDHLTALRYRDSEQFANLIARMDKSADQSFAVSVISLEEQMRGWLAEIRRRSAQPLKQVPVYARLQALIEFYNDWHVLPLDEKAARIFSELRKRKLRAGTQDRKIAAIAIANHALLLSANLVHFGQIAELQVADWLYAPPSS